MKRFFASVIAICISLTSYSLTHAQSTSIPFQDHLGHPYQEAIEYLYSRNVIHGYPNYTFQPDKLIKRAELIKIIVASNFDLLEYVPYADDSCFPDVPADQWFAEYVCFAKAKGIIEGYPDGYFRPDQEVNLVESLKMMYEGIGLAIPNPDAIFKFKYYSPAMKAGYIPDELSGEYAKLLTRGEVSEIMYRILTDEDKEMKSDILIGLTPHKQKYYASCGTAALAAALSNKVSVTEDEVIERMIQIGLYPNNPLSLEEGDYVWDDPHEVFVGDYDGIVSVNMSRLAGFGFLEDPLEVLAKEWASGSEKFSGESLSYIVNQLEEGYPVIVFASVSAQNGSVFLTVPGPYTVTWKLRNKDEMITVPMYKHNLVIEGYKGTVTSQEVFYIVDPFYGQKIEMEPYDLNNILKGYNFSGVVVKFDS